GVGPTVPLSGLWMPRFGLIAERSGGLSHLSGALSDRFARFLGGGVHVLVLLFLDRFSDRGERLDRIARVETRSVEVVLEPRAPGKPFFARQRSFRGAQERVDTGPARRIRRLSRRGEGRFVLLGGSSQLCRGVLERREVEIGDGPLFFWRDERLFRVGNRFGDSFVD